MQPDSPETRLGRLERQMARMEQRVEDLVTISLAHMREDMQDVMKAVTRLAGDFEQEKKDQATRQAAALKDSRAWRRALILGAFTVLAALITAAAAIVAAVVA